MSLVLPSRRITPPWTRNDLWRRARAVPSLDLRFADNKSLVDAVSGQSLVTFTRSSDGTFVGSDGLLQTAAAGVPRFDHNPTTGECLGLLVEEQRTNLLLRSSQFDTTWTNSNSSETSAAGIAPDGTNTAWSLTDTVDGAATNHWLQQLVTTVSGTAYTFSCYFKAGTFNSAALTFGSTGFGTFLSAAVDFSTLVTTVNAGVTASAVAANNGWIRLSATAAATAAASTAFMLRMTKPDGVNTGLAYQGNGTGTILLWGAQIEAGAFPTSYIPTTDSAATRNADVADIINTAIANGIRTLYAEFRSPASGTRGVASLNDSTANERAAINTSGTDPRLVVVDGGVTQADIDAGTIVANARSSMAARIAPDSFAASFNGGAVVTDTSGSLPTVDRLFIGRTQAGEYLNAPIARLIGWREALPDSVLQALTQ